MTRIRHSAIAAAALMLAACNADPIAPAAGITDDILTRDLASAVASAATFDLDQMASAEIAAGMPIVGSAPSERPLCPFSDLAGRFVCPPITIPAGPTLSRSYAIWAKNVPQAAYDPLVTDSVNVEWVVAGALSGPGRTAWLHDTRSLTVRGLAGAEATRTWRGIGARSDSVVADGDGPARFMSIEAVDRIDDVVYRLPRAAYPYPQSGTITHDIIGRAARDDLRGAARPFERHVVITFDGTRSARVFVGATPCTLDLVTRAMSCGR
jgi:hypothetical protein